MHISTSLVLTTSALSWQNVVGVTSGYTTAPAGFFKGVRRICDKYDIFLILDEVVCGMGRTQTLLAFEQEDLVTDIDNRKRLRWQRQLNRRVTNP